jgi:hypothetical protein
MYLVIFLVVFLVVHCQTVTGKEVEEVAAEKAALQARAKQDRLDAKQAAADKTNIEGQLRSSRCVAIAVGRMKAGVNNACK